MRLGVRLFDYGILYELHQSRKVFGIRYVGEDDEFEIGLIGAAGLDIIVSYAVLVTEHDDIPGGGAYPLGAFLGFVSAIAQLLDAIAGISADRRIIGRYEREHVDQAIILIIEIISIEIIDRLFDRRIQIQSYAGEISRSEEIIVYASLRCDGVYGSAPLVEGCREFRLIGSAYLSSDESLDGVRRNDVS